jgi:hypothetical protein
MGEYKETVRYWYKEKIPGKGFAIRANLDYNRLGVKRIILEVQFSESYHHISNSILLALNQLAFVTYFAKTPPGKRYIVDSSVPEEHLRTFY